MTYFLVYQKFAVFSIRLREKCCDAFNFSTISAYAKAVLYVHSHIHYCNSYTSIVSAFAEIKQEQIPAIAPAGICSCFSCPDTAGRGAVARRARRGWACGVSEGAYPLARGHPTGAGAPCWRTTLLAKSSVLDLLRPPGRERGCAGQPADILCSSQGGAAKRRRRGAKGL